MTKFSASQQSQLAQIGAFLREHRENQGKSLEDIAIHTYIRPQLLSGIEAGDPDMLPEPIFVQGFIRRYAETLGLQGTEIAQQFTVTSIPSTPRPARRTEQSESSTTRLTRRTTTTSRPPQATDNTTAPASGSSLFNAGSLSPLGEPFPNSASDDSAESAPRKVAGSPPKIPLIVDDAVADLPSQRPVTLDDGVMDTSTVDPGAMAPPSLTTGATQFDLPTIDSPTLDLPIVDPERNLADESSAFDQAILETASPEILTDTEFNTELPAAPVNTEFNDELPAAFTTEVKTTEPATAARSVYADERVGVEIHNEGPNLKPYAIGAVVIAALTAGIVLLANVLGGNDRSPVVDNPMPDIEQLEDPVVTEPDLPLVPPPVSSEPVYVEATATSEAWVSIIADGNSIFEGTLLAGDTQVWEAQENLSIYSGDAGALQLAANGSEAKVMGENGQPQEEIFTVP